MVTIAEFEIDGLPKMTNGIGPKHWRVKHNEAQKWKKEVFFYCWQNKINDLNLKKAKLTFTRCSSIEPDFDGLVSGFKHVLDGLVQAGVIVNDKVSNIGQPTYLWEKAAKNQGKIKIKIEVEK